MSAQTPSPADERFDRDPLQRTPLWVVLQALCRIVTTVMFGLKVHGKHHIPKTGGVLILANHQSYLDPILLAVQLDRPVSFFAKSGLFTNPFFGWLIRNLNAFPVRQGAGDVGAVKEAIRRLQQGHMLVIYPEGSRTEDGELQPVEPGAALVVRRADVTAVPAVIEGSFAAWPRRNKVFRPGRIQVLYGPPLDVDGKKAGEISSLIDRTFHRMLGDLRDRMSKDR